MHVNSSYSIIDGDMRPAPIPTESIHGCHVNEIMAMLRITIAPALILREGTAKIEEIDAIFAGMMSSPD